MGPQEGTFFQKAAIVIGGGRSAIALAAVERYADLGATRIMLVGRDRGRMEPAVTRLCERHPDLTPALAEADLVDPADAQRVADLAWERWGRIDVLVNSISGSHGPALLHTIPIEELGNAVTNQLMAPLHLCRAVVPYMQQQGSGAIVNVASDAAKSPTPGETAIGAAMAGIVMFSRTLAMEVKRNGIRVNVVTPSLVNSTGGFDRVMNDEFASRLFAKATKLAALGVAEPEDLAELIVFLTGPRSRRLTGQAVSVNGGISAL